MAGELIDKWPETWSEVWLPILDSEDAPKDLFCELYRELSIALKSPLSVEQLADIIDNPMQSREAFEASCRSKFDSEKSLINFLEASFDIMEDLKGEPLTNKFFNLFERFIEKYNIRYDLRRPFLICPTLPGFFTSLFDDLRLLSNKDNNLRNMLGDLEESIRDLRHGASDGRIKTCLAKQFMFLETLGRIDPEISAKTLGDICDQVCAWPHKAVGDSLKKLYGFASNYPGVRHGGEAGGKLREIDMRDMIAMSILLTGFTPYLCSQIDPESLYIKK